MVASRPWPNTGVSRASFSTDVSGRRFWSRVSPRYGVRRSSKKPRSYAAARLWWLAAASSSWDSRLTCHSDVVTAWCSPIDIPVRGSEVCGICGTRCPGRSPPSAFSRSSGVFARLAACRVWRSPSLTAMGASLALSTPPAIAESIWPSAILLATRIAASRPVPHACCTSKHGVRDDSRHPRTLSRVRLKSRLCLSTAPAATSPTDSPARPKRVTSPSSAAINMSWLDAWVYAPLARANGMRLPPTMTADRGPAVLPAMLPPGSIDACRRAYRSSGAGHGKTRPAGIAVASAPDPTGRLRSDADVLDLEVLFDALEPALTTEAGVLDPAEGRSGVGHNPLVDADHPELQRLANPQGAREIAGEDIGHQPVFRVVGPGDRLCLGGERSDRRHRTEDLLTHQHRVRGDAGQQRGRIEVTLVPHRGPAADDRGAPGRGIVDQCGDGCLGGRVDQWSDGDTVLGSAADRHGGELGGE